MAAPKPILITGATGKQGGSVLANLASHPSSSDFVLLAVTRNSSSAAAQKISNRFKDVLIVQGDLNDVSALFKTAEETLKKAGKPTKIWGVYSVQISLGPGVTFDSEIAQGKALIDQSVTYGIKHFVYSSVDRGGSLKSFENETPIPHFKSKYFIEKHLLEKAGNKGEKMGWTILRPVAFMDNLEPGMKTKVFMAALRDTIKDKPLQWVSTEDIGIFAAKAFCDPKSWNARAESLAGDELTFEEMSGCFERATGAPIPVSFSFLGGTLMWAVKEVNLMITWFGAEGYGADVEKLRQEEPRLCGFERWLNERSGFKN